MLFLFNIFLFSAFPCLLCFSKRCRGPGKRKRMGVRENKTKASITSHKGQNCHRSRDKNDKCLQQSLLPLPWKKAEKLGQADVPY